MDRDFDGANNGHQYLSNLRTSPNSNTFVGPNWDDTITVTNKRNDNKQIDKLKDGSNSSKLKDGIISSNIIENSTRYKSEHDLQPQPPYTDLVELKRARQRLSLLKKKIKSYEPSTAISNNLIDSSTRCVIFYIVYLFYAHTTCMHSQYLTVHIFIR